MLLQKDWFPALESYALTHHWDCITPAIREGQNNDCFDAYSLAYVEKMKAVTREGTINGICFMVHKRVFDKIGFFYENFIIGQYEDTDFFLRMKQAGFRFGTSGATLIQHFGSVTQANVIKSKQLPDYAKKNRLYFRKKWKLTWWKRKIKKIREVCQKRRWVKLELPQYAHTLFEKITQNGVEYR